VPSVQRGSVVKRGSKSWQARYRDENGSQRAQGGFETKTAARDWLDRKSDEILALKRGDFVRKSDRPTVTEIVDRLLDKHSMNVDASTLRTLRDRLKHATAAFGDLRPDDLTQLDLEAWRKTISPGMQHYALRAFRQALSWAVERKLATHNPSEGIRNPKRKRHERRAVLPFESWEEVETVAGELDPRYAAIPIFAVGTGLRPEEWIALERGDVDRQAGVVRIRRRFTQGVLKEGGKTEGSVRAVPLRKRVLDALDAHPARLDTRILFPAPRGGYIDLEKFRYREWTPAVKAAGVEHRRVYDCRHTFCTWAIESGMSLILLAPMMGTSVREIEDTYFRSLDRTDGQVRAQLDAYDEARGNTPGTNVADCVPS
jgi:integrase